MFSPVVSFPEPSPEVRSQQPGYTAILSFMSLLVGKGAKGGGEICAKAQKLPTRASSATSHLGKLQKAHKCWWTLNLGRGGSRFESLHMARSSFISQMSSGNRVDFGVLPTRWSRLIMVVKGWRWFHWWQQDIASCVWPTVLQEHWQQQRPDYSELQINLATDKTLRYPTLFLLWCAFGLPYHQ